MADRSDVGATSIKDEDKKKGLWWLWALLALLALLALILFLLALDDDDNDNVDASGGAAVGDVTTTTVDESSTTTTELTTTTERETTTTTAPTTTTTTTASGGSSGTASDAALTSNGEALLPLPAGGLAAFITEPVTADSVDVYSVVTDQGFWVGDSAEQRIFVLLDTGGIESPQDIDAGDEVSFEGTVVPNPDNFVDQLGLGADEGADLLQEQGHHIVVALTQLEMG